MSNSTGVARAPCELRFAGEKNLSDPPGISRSLPPGLAYYLRLLYYMVAIHTKEGLNFVCGFCGFTGELEAGLDVLSSMMERIKHRGSDYSKVFSAPAYTVGFCGFKENTNDQEYTSLHYEDKDIVVVFDGQIENYYELRKTLEALGHRFIDDTQLSLISHLYNEYNRDMLKHLHGSFAFVIYDIKNNLIFAARDRLACKPLYYSINNGRFLFSSELKGLLGFHNFKATLNEAALEQYLSFQYSVLPETFFKGVYQLQASEYLIFQNNELKVEKYSEFNFTPISQSLDEAVNKIEKAVLSTIETHKQTNSDMGSFLSGGVDSSLIVGCYRPQKCFTVGYDNGNYSEIEYAEKLTKHFSVQHEVRLIKPEEYFDVLPKAIYYMDEPVADPAAIAFYLACESASKHVKVAFSGEGPDEFFGGYGQYFEPFALDKISFIPMGIRRAISKFLSKLPFSIKGMGYLIRAGKTVEERFIGNAYIFSKKEREAILKSNSNAHVETITKPLYDKVKDHDDVTKMQFIDINLWMAGDILHQADRMSMAHSLLLKTPFLNKNVIEAALSLPTKFRVTSAGNKIAFRAAAMKHLPKEVAQRKKLGFPVPLREWLKDKKFYSLVEEYFLSDTAAKFFHTEKLLGLLRQHSTRTDNSRKIWTVLIFLIWYKQYFEGGRNESA